MSEQILALPYASPGNPALAYRDPDDEDYEDEEEDEDEDDGYREPPPEEEAVTHGAAPAARAGRIPAAWTSRSSSRR